MRGGTLVFLFWRCYGWRFSGYYEIAFVTLSRYYNIDDCPLDALKWIPLVASNCIGCKRSEN